MLTFAAMRVPDAIKVMNQRNTRKIIVIGTRLTNETVTGGFSANDPDGFATMLAALFHVRLAADATGNVVLNAER